jgi:adenylate cyclase
LASKFSSFLAELRRRRVTGVALAYLVAGAVVAGAANDVMPNLSLPPWTVTFVIVLLLFGFPIALVLAWAYEIRPDSGRVGEGIDASADHRSSTIDQEQKVSGPLPRDRIAVLPFASINPDREHDYFADGITEELISAISRIQGLDVIARTSVIRYKDSDTRIGEIARDLFVGVILEGSVRKAGDQVRVTVQLIDAGSEGHLWSEDYDREFREIFSVQRDIATHVAEALKLRLLVPDAESIGAAPTEDLAAYDLYLLGRHHLTSRADAGIRKAISSFARAVELDPEFAPAFAGLADAFLLAGIGYVAEPPEDAFGQAWTMARRALDLNDGLAEAHTSLGYCALLKWDIRTAETELRRAIAVNPSYALAHQWLGQFLSAWLGRHAEGIEEVERALALDPLSAIITTELGWVFQYMEDYERAVVQYDQALGMDPDLAIAHFNRGDALQKLNRLEDAIASYDRALDLNPGMPWARAFLASAHAESGRVDAAEEVLGDLLEQEGLGHPVATFVAVLQEALGMKEEALASLKRAVENREPMAHGLSAMKGFLSFPSLRTTPEFEELLETIDGILGR